MKAHEHSCERCQRLLLIAVMALAGLALIALLYLKNYEVSRDDQGRLQLSPRTGTTQLVEDGGVNGIK